MLDWLAHRASISPQKVALIAGEQCWTYEELNHRVAGMTGQLAAAGVETGQHITVLMPNRVEVVCLIHALARLQAVMVPLNIRLADEELRWQVHQADCSFIICDEQIEGQAVSLINTGRRVLSVDRPQEPSIEALDSYASDVKDWQSRPLDLDSVQGIVFTSGTTGLPKGAMLTFGNHFWGATASAYRLGTDPADRWLVCMPLYHVGGIAIIFRCCLYGTTIVLQSGFEPSAVSQALQNQKVTLVSLVPTMLLRLLETHQESFTSSQLRCILLGGAAAQPSLLEQALALNLPVATTYGLTEAASQVATATPDEVVRKSGSVGKPLMFSSVHIFDQDGQECPIGEVGEIVVSGPAVMQGYYKQPDASQKTLHNGWLHTGDMGYLDEDGDLWVMQRRADLIVSGGENVYPVEIEQVLRRHPNVKDICVVGVADEEWGQRVAAAVVLNGARDKVTEQALIAFCRECLAGYKQPSLIRFVEALPMTASGKVRRDKVRELMS